MNLISKELVINYSCLQEVAIFNFFLEKNIKVKERLWFIHKEFLVGLWWKLRSPDSWSNGLTTKSSPLTSCTFTLRVDVGGIVTVWTHLFSFFFVFDYGQAARYQVFGVFWSTDGQRQIQADFMIQRFWELWFMTCCCYLQNAVRANGLWSSAHFHFECGCASPRRYAAPGKLPCHLAFHRAWDTGPTQSRLKATERTCFLMHSPYVLLNTEAGESTGILSTQS